MNQFYLHSSPEGVIKLIEGDKMPPEPEYGICSEEPRPDCFNKEDCRCGLQWKPYRNALQSAKKQAVTVQNREVAHAVIVRDGHHLDKFGEPKNDFIYGPFALRYEVKSVLVLEKNTPGVSRIRHYEKRAILYDDTPEKEESQEASKLKLALQDKIKEFEAYKTDPRYQTEMEQNAVVVTLRELRYLDSIAEYE